MININIRTNDIRKAVIEATSKTPRDIFTANNVPVTRALKVSISGRQLDDDEIDQTFADLGIEDDTTIVLSGIVKDLAG